MTVKSAKSRQVSDSMLNAFFVILSGGFQDAYTYCCRGSVFANAQTGNIVLMSTVFLNGDIKKAVSYLIPVFAFILGTFLASVIHGKMSNSKKLHWRQAVLAIEISLLFSVGFIPESYNALANALVSLVCAFQVQTFTKVKGHAYASTMCIGNMRSGTAALYEYFHTKDISQLKKALTYYSVILIFAIGAAAGSFFTALLGLKAIFICCVLLLISFVMMAFDRSSLQEECISH